MRQFVIPSALPILAACGLAACSATKDSTTPAGCGSSTTQLTRAQSCADVTQNLRDDAHRKIDAAIAGAGAAVRAYGPNAWWYGYGGYYDAAVDARAGAPMPAAPPGANAGATAGGAESTPKASTFTDTNTQVAGVDEADIAKTDGRYLWILHGSTLRTVKAFPTADLADLGDAASSAIEGSPMEMFVHEGKAVVFSNVDGTSLYRDARLPNRGDYDDANVLGVARVAGSPIADDIYGYYRPLTKVTVLTVEGNRPAVVSEQYFEGNYVSSRRVDNQVRIVLTGHLHEARSATFDAGWQTPPATVAEALSRLETMRSRLHVSVATTGYLDWMPARFRRSGATAQAEAAVACEDVYFPQPGSSQAGISQVHILDLANVAAGVQSTAVLGNTEVVYGNAGELVLASRAWYGGIGWGARGGMGVAEASPSTGTAPPASSGSSGSGSTPASPPAPTPTPAPMPDGAGMRTQDITTPDGLTWTATTRTHLHRFTIAVGGRPNYVASGSIPGFLKDQFAIDSKDGILRVTSTEDFGLAAPPPATTRSFSAPPRINHLFTLRGQGTNLSVLGDAGAIAPTESIYSTRFVGNHAYVVTFRQVDPLFVFDLTNPAVPVKLGELKIPGFSEYMQPIDDNHLLTIGKDATEQGRITGLSIQLFDVTDKTRPAVQGKFVFPNEGGWASSEAEHNHKAFTYSPVNKMLAIPMQRWTNGAYTASFEFFKVDPASTTASVDRLGFVDHAQVFGRTAANPAYCGYTVQPRRSFFYEGDVVTLSTAGVVANRAADLAPIRNVRLPAATASGVTPGGGPSGTPRPAYCE